MQRDRQFMVCWRKISWSKTTGLSRQCNSMSVPISNQYQLWSRYRPVAALPFSPSVSQVLDTERGLNKDEWRPAGAPFDIGAPLLMTMNASRKNVAKGLASMTGGEYQLFASSKSFEDHMFDFTNRLHSRYVLSFQPKEPHAGLHRLTVRLRGQSDLRVLARTSYWAQK